MAAPATAGAWLGQPAFVLPDAGRTDAHAAPSLAALGRDSSGQRCGDGCGGALFGIPTAPCACPSVPTTHWPTVRQAFAPSTASLLPADLETQQSLAEETTVQQQRLEQMRASMRAVKRQQLGHHHHLNTPPSPAVAAPPPSGGEPPSQSSSHSPAYQAAHRC